MHNRLNNIHFQIKQIGPSLNKVVTGENLIRLVRLTWNVEKKMHTYADTVVFAK